MSMNRRNFVAMAAGTGAALAAPSLVHSQGAGEPLRVGLLTAKTGPFASGGLDMERGLQAYLAANDQRLGGRKVELARNSHGLALRWVMSSAAATGNTGIFRERM